jgi:hypothetical protein
MIQRFKLLFCCFLSGLALAGCGGHTSLYPEATARLVDAFLAASE